MSAGTTELDSKIAKFQEIQETINKLFSQKTTFLSQFNENTLVSGELDLLKEDDRVYKLVGPVLMTVELEESKSNVKKRLEFIEAEIKKLDSLIAVKQGEQTEVSEEIGKLQQAMQSNAAAAAQEIVSNV